MKKIIITSDNIETIIGKYLDEQASEEELFAFTKWRQASLENEKYFRSIAEIDESYRELGGNRIDVDKAWHHVQERMNTPEEVKLNPGIWKYLGYAASFILLISALYVIWPEKQVNSFLSEAVPLELDMKDGSSVVLGPNSMLNRIEDNSRSYNFTGQASFEVTHSEEKPFTLFINDLIVQDLGTVFQVKALPGNDTVYVQVKDGLVQFYTKILDGIQLEEGEEGMFIKSKNEFFKRSMDPASPYLSKKFEDATLGMVADHLAYAFRKTIQMENPDIENCSIAVDFTKAPYDLVKEIIEETLDITFIEEDNTLVLSGIGCQ
jgi:ferric-dicitrate binding protein FerR (iron transport regulator)